MFGTVTRYFNDKGYGFIRGEFVSDRSDYNAADVSVIDAPERNRQHGKGNK
jgi:hypothetical protein